MTDNFKSALAKAVAAPRQTVTAKILEREKKAGGELKPFLVTYRIASADVPGKGDYDHRRKAVVEGIQALSGETHLSTSVWKVHSRHSSIELRNLLSEPLDVKHDFLSVTSVGPTRTFGNADLED